MARTVRDVALATLLVLPFAWVACGGGHASVGGTLSGLPAGTQVTLQNNLVDDLDLGTDGSFWFDGVLVDGATYHVTLARQPVGGSCTVTHASGTIDSLGSDVSSLVVACSSTASVTGTLSGLADGTSVTLNNGNLALTVGSNGAFAFPGLLPDGTAYRVTVSMPPAGQSCSVSNGSGTVLTGTRTAITVICA